MNISKVKNFFLESKGGQLLLSFAAGTLYAAALPPLNLSFCALITLTVPLYIGSRSKWYFSMLCSWVWGIGWSFFAYNFLREIAFAVPFGLAPVISLWPAVWGAALPWLWKRCCQKQNSVAVPWYKMLLFAFLAAALFTLLEWTRSRLFVWNDFSVTMWRRHAIIQLAALTGSYGVGFLVSFTNTLIFGAAMQKSRKSLYLLLIAVVMWLAVTACGICRLAGSSVDDKGKNKTLLRTALIQPDLSQRRHASVEQVYEAVDKCVMISRRVVSQRPELIIWPESAVPVTLRGMGQLNDYYRTQLASLISEARIPMLIGAIDYLEASIRARDPYPAVTNSAIWLDKNGRIKHKYDKIHRVPYGEYIPFRRFLPGFILNMIDMGRDLAPGTNFEVYEFKPGVRAATVICYEGVFGYLTRDFARRGANVLIALSNDAWYPASSEPEQHLANVVMRCIETGLPMIRCGNNGGSGVVTPYGLFVNCIGSKAERPELLREQACGIVEISLDDAVARTFYVRYGEWFIALLALLSAAGITALFCFKRPE